VADFSPESVAEFIGMRTIVAPGAYVVEPEGTEAWKIVLPSRASARHVISCFGGKLKSRSSR
jgi:hypothetical protein